MLRKQQQEAEEARIRKLQEEEEARIRAEEEKEEQARLAIEQEKERKRKQKQEKIEKQKEAGTYMSKGRRFRRTKMCYVHICDAQARKNDRRSFRHG